MATHAPNPSQDPKNPQPQGMTRRGFLGTSLAAPLAAAPLLMSLEERALAAQTPAAAGAAPAKPAAAAPAKPADAGGDKPAKPAARPGDMPMGKIGNVKISRLICGGNLISGYAHSRDLIYVSPLLKHYFSDEKIMETWALCEEHGVNTMVAYPGDPRCVKVYLDYIKRGGKMQYLAQIRATPEDLKTGVSEARDAGAVGAFLLGNVADKWVRDGAAGRVGEIIGNIEAAGLIAGTAGHELRVPQAVEKAGFQPDFYVKTFHSTDYWSKQRPDQTKDVVDNYGCDNYWCQNPPETAAFMATVKRPWIAYKVLAAGALKPKAGFRYAFENGADYVLVGMFDFQIAEDAALTHDIVAATQKRARPWA